MLYVRGIKSKTALATLIAASLLVKKKFFSKIRIFLENLKLKQHIADIIIFSYLNLRFKKINKRESFSLLLLSESINNYLPLFLSLIKKIINLF